MTVDFVLVSFQDRRASQRIRRQLARTVTSPYTLRVVSNTRRNLGWACACNKGALGGEGELIGFLNQDLELRPGWLEPVIEALRADPKLAIAGPRCLDGGSWPRLPAGLEQWVCGACMLIRRDFFERVGGFDSERFPHEYAETDLERTAVAQGYTVRTTERGQVVHHYSPEKSQQVLRWRAQGARNEAEKWGVPVDRWGVAHGGFDEEVYYSLLQAGVLRDDLQLLVKARETCPNRWEASYELASRLNRKAKPRLAAHFAQAGLDAPDPNADTLFAARWMREWGLAFELSIALWWIGEYDRAVEIWRTLLERDDLPEHVRSAVTRNHATFSPGACGGTARRSA